MTTTFPTIFVLAMGGICVTYTVLMAVLERTIGRRESTRRLHAAQRIWANEQDIELAIRQSARIGSRMDTAVAAGSRAA